jgi:hypothetical protein
MKKYLFIALSLIVFGCNSSIIDDPSTIISFSIPEPAHVKLSVENSYDTIVAILIDQDMQSGSFNVQFNASDLAEGIYYYTIKMTGQSGNVIQMTKRMLLIK